MKTPPRKWKPLRDEPQRYACAVCGAPNVAHTQAGEPYHAHKRSKQHNQAAARELAVARSLEWKPSGLPAEKTQTP